MTVKKFNISKPRKYKDKQGIEKTQWNNIGTITEFHKDDGNISRIIEIPAIGLEANIFPWTPKEPTQPKAEIPNMNSSEINIDDIPFV